MKLSDQRAELALAIIATILSRIKWSVDGGPPLAPSAADVSQSLIICLAMLVDADERHKHRNDLTSAAEVMKQDLITQLMFMRDHYDRTGETIWEAVAPAASWWW